MKVIDLIKCLQKMPQDAEVCHLWGGDARTSIEFVWLSKGCDGHGKKFVVTSDYDQPCYYENSRPISAPTEEQDMYWSTPTEGECEEGCDKTLLE